MPERSQKRLSDDDAGPSQRPGDAPFPSSELRASGGGRVGMALRPASTGRTPVPPVQNGPPSRAFSIRPCWIADETLYDRRRTKVESKRGENIF